MAGSDPWPPRTALAAPPAASRPAASTPIEIVQHHLASGEPDRAVRVAFERALADLIRGTGVPARADLTGREFLAWAMGHGSPIAALREPFERLHRLYEPARFGDGAETTDGLVAILTEIYRRPELGRLYRGGPSGPGGS